MNWHYYGILCCMKDERRRSISTTNCWLCSSLIFVHIYIEHWCLRKWHPLSDVDLNQSKVTILLWYTRGILLKNSKVKEKHIHFDPYWHTFTAKGKWYVFDYKYMLHPEENQLYLGGWFGFFSKEHL